MKTIKRGGIMATVLLFDISESAMKWGAIRDGAWVSGDEAFFPLNQRERRLEMTFRELDPFYGITTWDEIWVSAYSHMHEQIQQLFEKLGHTIILHNRFQWLHDRETIPSHVKILSFEMEQFYVGTWRNGDWKSSSHKGHGIAYIADCLSLEEEYDCPQHQYYTPLVSSEYYNMLTNNKKTKTVEIPGLPDSIELLLEYSTLFDILSDNSWVRIWNSFMMESPTEDWMDQDRTVMTPDAIYVMGIMNNDIFNKAIQQIFTERFGQEVTLITCCQDTILRNLANHVMALHELHSASSEAAVSYEVVSLVEEPTVDGLQESVLDTEDLVDNTPALLDPVEDIDVSDIEVKHTDPNHPLESYFKRQKPSDIKMQEVRLDDRYIYWGNVSLEWINGSRWLECDPNVIWVEIPYPIGLSVDLDQPYILVDKMDDLEGIPLPEGLKHWKGPVVLSFTENLSSADGIPIREIWIRQSITRMLEWAAEMGWGRVGLSTVRDMDVVMSSLYGYFSSNRLHIIDRISIQWDSSCQEEFEPLSYMMHVYGKWPQIAIPSWRQTDLQRIYWVSKQIDRDLNDPQMKVQTVHWKLLLQAYLNDHLNDQTVTRTITDDIDLDPNLVFHHWYQEVQGTSLDPSINLEGMNFMNTMLILECWVRSVPQEELAIRLLASLYHRMEIYDRPLCDQVLENNKEKHQS
jgi:hypothetical protein